MHHQPTPAGEGVPRDFPETDVLFVSLGHGEVMAVQPLKFNDPDLDAAQAAEHASMVAAQRPLVAALDEARAAARAAVFAALLACGINSDALRPDDLHQLRELADEVEECGRRVDEAAAALGYLPQADAFADLAADLHRLARPRCGARVRLVPTRGRRRR